MQQGYFAAAWNDIKNSPGWFGKVIILGLVALIPVFGWIVVAGYLSGWARDKAWGVHAPLPARIFGNEDGKLYSRGFFLLVLALVCSLLPWVIELFSSILTGDFFWSSGAYHRGMMSFPFGAMSGVLGLVLGMLSFAAIFFAALFFYVGSMRVSIYGRLSAGFQIEKMWKMMRYDTGGLLRILGMAILLFLILSIVAGLLIFVVVLLSLFVGFFVTGGNLNINTDHINAGIFGMIFAISSMSIAAGIVSGAMSMMFAVFALMMIARAMGYWTQQFNVAAWRGQDDPMPFECEGASGYQQPPR